MSYISTGADWDFELIEKYEREIAKSAAGFKLDTYPNQIEVISSEQMLDAYASAGLPVMRKDFLVTPKQILESRALGADGVLLIAAILPGRELASMLAAASDAGLFALVEVFDETDLRRAADCGARLVGVNCRNLRDLSVDFARFERLRGLIAPTAQAVAESGIATPGQFARVAALGYDAALIGSALMKGATIGELQASSR